MGCFCLKTCIFQCVVNAESGTVQMHWTNWYVVTWIYGKFVAWNTPPPPTINGAFHSHLAPWDPWLPGPGRVIPGLVSLQNPLGPHAWQYPSWSWQGWCHVRWYEKSSTLKEGHVHPPKKIRGKKNQGERCLKTKIRPKCETYEVFSDRKNVFLVERKVGIGGFSSCSSLTPTRDIALVCRILTGKKRRQHRQKNGFPVRCFSLKQMSVVSKVRNEKCY